MKNKNRPSRKAFDLTSIALTVLALASFATISAAETPDEMKPINVKDFGAKGDGVTADTAAINAAIVAAQKQGAGAVVSLPSGRYKTAQGKEKSIRITGADGLTFQGEGDTTIVSGDLDEPVFRIVDSKSVTVRKISIDHDPLGFTQGTITSVDVPNMTCEVSMDPDYPAPNDPSFKGSQVHPFVFPEKNYYQLDRHWPNPSEMVKTGEHTWRWKLKGPPNIENWPGKRFFIYTESRSQAFMLSNLSDTTLEDINYWGGGANAGYYIRGLEGTTTFRRFVIGVPPGSNRLYSCTGGGQISGLRGKLLLDQCDFSKIDDDGIDILADYTRIIEQRDKRTLLVQAKKHDYRTGDRVELWDWQHKKMRADAIITTATPNPDGTFVVALDRDVVTERVGVGVGMNFSRESMTDGIDRLINVATVGQETIIRDSKFQVFRAKCLNLKAANCTIERCTFRNSFQPAVFAAPEWYFEEGSSIRNFTVRDCTFTDNNHPNIVIGASPISGVPGTKPIVSDTPENISHDSTKILIEGNSFSGFGTTPSVFGWNWPVGPAITITNAADVTIRNNTFGPLAESAPKGTPKVLVEKSNDVQIMNNKGLSAEETTVRDLNKEHPDTSKDSPRLVLDADTGISIREGFDAELLYEVPKSQGSWVAMAFDPKGRLIVSDQDDKGVFRVTLPSASAAIKVESLPGFPYDPVDWGTRKVGGAYGFLYAFDSLYMSNMRGFYRIRDTDGDDQFDEFTLLQKLDMGYEHSAHSIIQTADGKGLYLVSGNFTRVPKGTTSAQPPVWKEDTLLPVIPDPMGHAVGLKAPGGWICRISPDGKDWKMIASGFRNAVDIALNREGELFTYDSDMEFDVGVPWYRPTRINHVTNGAEFGWRANTGVWLDYFADSLGSVLDMGPGSPTAISFGHHSNFPAEFQDKLFVCDWTFGTIYTVDMQESGSSYTATKTEFLHGSPLNIAAMRFGPDGAMYFVTGGRTTASRLYRIRYTGEKTAGTPKTLLANSELRALRHSLEKLHARSEAGADAVEKAWPHLSHVDRNIRYAARIAIECQDLALWRGKVFAEKNPRTVIYASIALCRHGDKSLSGRLLDKLGELSFGPLEKEDQLALLRAYALCFVRMGQPAGDKSAAVIAKLDAHYPSKDDTVNAELCRVLASLDAPTVVGKTIALMKSTHVATANYDKEMLGRHEYGEAILKMMANTPNTRNIHYAYCLRRVHNGWTIEDRKYFFGWLNESLAKDGGKSFAGYIRAIRMDAIAQLETKDLAPLAGLLGDLPSIDLAKLPKPKGPPGAWTVDTAMKLFASEPRGRNFENGKKMFSAGLCIACHRFGGEGGVTGPDLGSVGNRYSIRDILVAICEPSASISEQYMASTVKLKDGSALYGRLIIRNETEVGVASNPFDLNQITKAPAEKVESIEFSNVSIMPQGMISGMNRDELMDLMAYLLSGGDSQHKAFKKE